VGAENGDAAWPGFRGPGGTPVSDNDKLPLHWSVTENVEWRADISGLSWSSPIVAGDIVFVTSAIGARETTKNAQLGTDFSNDYIAELREQGLPIGEVIEKHNERFIEFPEETELDYALVALSLETGEELWRRTFFSGPPPGGRHAKNTFSSETPVTDGESVYVYVGNLGLWAFSLEGVERWHRELDAFDVYMSFGPGGSAALTEEHVVILNDNQEHQFIAAFYKKDGREAWRTARQTVPQDRMIRTSWSTPFVWRHDLRTEIVALGPFMVLSYDTRGNELWRMSNHSALPVPTPFAYGGNLFVVSGVLGDRFRPITSIRPGASGDLTLEEGAMNGEFVRWYDKAAGPYIPTPVAYDGSIWVVYDKGIFARYDADTGERRYRGRIEGSSGAFSASPWAYRDTIFAIDEEGTTFAFGTGDEFEQLHANPLGEKALASPAIVGDRLLIRTRNQLFSIRER
ncbi:MAG: PQQ-binding-like beta-propeller repeat protein, partial [Acidobacteriota bacterium]|nr:PQQ-binding-like beta-propeller repeat protein [Acidobacteriota bacterium]